MPGLNAGMPPNVISYDAELAKEANRLAEAWHLADVMGRGIDEIPSSVEQISTESWSPEQVNFQCPSTFCRCH